MSIYSGKNYRKIYENHYGPIPKDEDGRAYEIHHLDGDHSNDLPDNLKALTIQEHYDIHYRQGDWWACRLIAFKMKISPEEISRLASLSNLKRVADGTNPFQKRADGTSVTSDKVKNGTHPFLGGKIAGDCSRKRVADGTHNLLGGKIAGDCSRKRVADGIHHFLGGEIQRKSARERVANGTNPFQHPKHWKCEHCGTEGKGSANFNRWHGDNCKNFS